MTTTLPIGKAYGNSITLLIEVYYTFLPETQPLFTRKYCVIHIGRETIIPNSIQKSNEPETRFFPQSIP